MQLKPEELREKGWSEAEIKRTQKILNKAKRKKHPHHDLLHESLFWGMLFIAVITMVAIAYWIIPLFLFLKSKTLYPLMILIGIGFGVLFQHVLKDLDQLELHHHIIISLAIPIIGLISFVAILGRFDEGTIGILHRPITVGVIFVISFFLPYITHFLIKR